MAYLSVAEKTVTEKIIEKSRFLSYIGHIEGEESARSFLAGVRAEHPLATHVCFGYVADKLGNEQRFSDDGEPQGTAGMPILNVIKAQKLFETAIAVVRYFGGIKLGAGGLTRAYASSAAEAVSAAEKRLYDMCVELKISVDYAEVNAATRFFEESDCELLSREFGERACFTAAVREERSAEFIQKLTDRLNGRAETEELRRQYYPFQVK